MRQITFVSSGTRLVGPGEYPGWTVKETPVDGGVICNVALYDPETGLAVPHPPQGVQLYEANQVPRNASNYAMLNPNA